MSPFVDTVLQFRCETLLIYCTVINSDLRKRMEIAMNLQDIFIWSILIIHFNIGVFPIRIYACMNNLYFRQIIPIRSANLIFCNVIY